MHTFIYKIGCYILHLKQDIKSNGIKVLAMHEDYNVGYFGDERLKKTAPYGSNDCTITRWCVYVVLAVTGQPKLNLAVGSGIKK